MAVVRRNQRLSNRRRGGRLNVTVRAPLLKKILVGILLPLFFVVWGLGILYVLFSKDITTTASTTTPVSTENMAAGQLRRSVVPSSSLTEDLKSPDCETYGCPVYPPEINDTIVNKTLDEIKVTSPLAVTAIAAAFFATRTYATITRQSNQHEFNQDRSFLIQPFMTQQTTRRQQDEKKKSFLVAILDGHGVEGHIVAEYAKVAIPNRLAQKLDSQPCCQSDDWIAQQLKDTFIEVNQEAPSNALRGGCTASVSLRIGNKLFVANAGDSRTILVKYSHLNDDHPSSTIKEEEPFDKSFGNWTTGNTTIENGIVHEIPFMTRKDKANLPEERARIESMQGKIHIPPHNPNLSRVIVYSKAAQPPESIGLAMSRSIGDWEWKQVGVTAEPIVNVVHLENYYARNNGDASISTLLLIAASDGLWDVRKPQFYAKRYRAAFFPQPQDVRHPHPLETTVNMVWQVAPADAKWYRDDMSVVALQIQPS